MKYASYNKRILSSLIDLAILYSALVVIYYFYPDHYNFGLDITVFFLCSISYHFMFYKNQGHTVGEKTLKLKVVFTSKVKNKNLYYLIKAFVISTVYFPFFSMRSGAAAFIVGTIILQFYPKIREKKILIWDLFSKTAVVEEEK